MTMKHQPMAYYRWGTVLVVLTMLLVHQQVKDVG